MKIRFGSVVTAMLGVALVSSPARAQDKTELKDQKEKVSYGIGMNIGMNLKRSGYDVDVDIMAGAIKDMLAGRELKMTEQQAREVLTAYQGELSAKREEERKKLAEKNRKEGETFLAENKQKPNIKTHSVTLPDGTAAEMQYKVLAEGSGAMPKSNDTVTVNYRGTLISGKEFDSSTKRGQPTKFQVNRVIRGWTEGLQLMKTGAKYELYLPSTLGYGDMGSGPNIEPGSTLIFEVELLAVEPAQPPPTPQPLTSDIIRVPSAEELKKGAKVEIIKAEDVEKQIKAAAATNQPPKQ